MNSTSIYSVTNSPANITKSHVKIFPPVVSVDRTTRGILSGGSEDTEIILDCCGDRPLSRDGDGSAGWGGHVNRD